MSQTSKETLFPDLGKRAPFTQWLSARIDSALGDIASGGVSPTFPAECAGRCIDCNRIELND